MNNLIAHLFLSLVLFSFTPFLSTASNKVDSLINVLDRTLPIRETFENKRLQQIANIKKEISFTTDSHRHYELLGDLFELYKVFQLDSASVIADKRYEVALLLDDSVARYNSIMNQAEVRSVTGMYKEADDLMNSVNYKELDTQSKVYFFHLSHAINTLMINYSINKNDQSKYQKIVFQYKDSLLKYTPIEDPVYSMTKSTRLIMLGKTDEALDVASACYQDMLERGDNTAIITHVLSEIYEAKGDLQMQKYYLLLSALEDIHDGKNEYISLRRLAVMMYEKGDINRAYNYMKCSMEDAIYCNARLRALEITRLLPIINGAYDVKSQNERTNLISFTIAVSILMFFLFGAIIYIYIQLKAISKIRKSLKNMNQELLVMNEDLNSLNSVLSESNHVKEEYIGYVFSICSAYIDKMEDFRKNINRKLKTGKVEDVVMLTNPSSSLIQNELKEFYKNFDTIFLNLYPDFVDQFNTLLSSDEKIFPKEGELLSPELRIFALVRLGISDSVKIANFLHYSPQTVYNYRLKVRNKSVLPKEDFPTAVSKIGKLKV